MPLMKICTKCLKSLSPENFYVRRASRDGLNARCKTCTSADCAEAYAANPQPAKDRATEAYLKNPEEKRKYGRDYYAANRDAVKSKVGARHKKLLATDAAFATALRSRVAKRRATRKNATPLWADSKAMKVFYDVAADLTAKLGTPHEVDHIVPLQSKIVCGLHNQFNLQVIPLKKNRAKSNKTWPDMP
jgi:hypothetical protein